MVKRFTEGSLVSDAMMGLRPRPTELPESNVPSVMDIMVKGQLMTLIEVSTARPATMSQRR